MGIFDGLFKTSVTAAPVAIPPLPVIPPSRITVADAGVVTAPTAPQEKPMTTSTATPVSAALTAFPQALKLIEDFAAKSATTAASFADLGVLSTALHAVGVHPEFKVTKMSLGEAQLDGDLKILGDSITLGSVTLIVRLGR